MKEILIIILLCFLNLEKAKGQQSLKESDADLSTKVIQETIDDAILSKYGEPKNLEDTRKQKKGTSRRNIVKQQSKKEKRKRERKVRRRNKSGVKKNIIKRKNASRSNNKMEKGYKKTGKNRKHKKYHKNKKGENKYRKKKNSSRKNIKREKMKKLRKKARKENRKKDMKRINKKQKQSRTNGCIVEDGVFISAGNNAPNGEYLVTSGPFECASKCYSNPDCIAWTLKLSDNKCWLKTVYEGYTAKNDSWITGTKACGEPQETCPVGWTKLATGCYHVTESATFNNVTALCKPGGYLVEVNNIIEQDTLRTWYRDIRAYTNERIWLGATDSAKEGDWRWIHSGQPITYSNWYPGEPNNAGDENCLVGEEEQFQWQDIACSWNHRAICEYSGTTTTVAIPPTTTPPPTTAPSKLTSASCEKSPGALLHVMADFYIRFYRTNRRIIRMARRLSDMERIMTAGYTFSVEADYLASLTNNGTGCPQNPSLSGNVTSTIASLRACPTSIASSSSCSQYQVFRDELAARRLGSKTKIGGSFSDCPSTDTACQCQQYFDRNWNRAYTSCTNGANPNNLNCTCYEKLNTEPANPYSDPVDGCQTKNTEKYSDKIDKEIKPLWDNCLLKEAECQQLVSKALELTASCAAEVTTAVTTASSVRRKRNQLKFRNLFA